MLACRSLKALFSCGFCAALTSMLTLLFPSSTDQTSALSPATVSLAFTETIQHPAKACSLRKRTSAREHILGERGFPHWNSFPSSSFQACLYLHSFPTSRMFLFERKQEQNTVLWGIFNARLQAGLFSRTHCNFYLWKINPSGFPSSVWYKACLALRKHGR